MLHTSRLKRQDELARELKLNIFDLVSILESSTPSGNFLVAIANISTRCRNRRLTNQNSGRANDETDSRLAIQISEAAFKGRTNVTDRGSCGCAEKRRSMVKNAVMVAV